MPTRGEWDRSIMMRLLSEKRMSTYLVAANGNVDSAFALYAHNLRIAGILLKATAMVEVVVRNSIDQTLSEWNDAEKRVDDWFNSPMLDTRAREDLLTARSRITRRGQDADHDAILTELSFGFWRFLVSRKYYASLWVPALHDAFHYGDPDLRIRQRETVRLLGNLNYLRNRAAHLEPVFTRNFTKDLSEARRLMSWVNPHALFWFDDNLTATSVAPNE